MTTQNQSTCVHLIVLSAILVTISAGNQSCDDTATTLCDEWDIRCPPGWACALHEAKCIEDGCGDGIVDQEAGELCDDGDTLDTGHCDSDCRIPANCGNGRMEDMEVCDDGNTRSGDGCSSDCQSDETCGNGYRDKDEACDDGDLLPSDTCSVDCQFLTCGNGNRDPGEVCEDGNNESGDRCSFDCLSIEVCGNGYVDVNEECDVGKMDDMTCDAEDCSMPKCGDDYVNHAFINPVTGKPEECDDGNNNNGDDCPDGKGGTCEPARCGDRFVKTQGAAREECDDGNELDEDDCVECKQNICGDGFVDREGDGVENKLEECDRGDDNSDTEANACRSSCRWAFCGDSVKDSAEECDDGNSSDRDGCVQGCKTNVCGDGFVDDEDPVTEACDDGNDSNSDDCVQGCLRNVCGDGFLDTEEPQVEVCDEGAENSQVPNADCRLDCTRRRCGDRVIDSDNDEQCDDGNDSNLDNCLQGCMTNTCGDGFLDMEEPQVEVCDEGGENSQDPNAECRLDCTRRRCGDYVADDAFSEQCDTGGETAQCDGDCTAVLCGDGYVNPLAGEQCDPRSMETNCPVGSECFEPDCICMKTEPARRVSFTSTSQE